MFCGEPSSMYRLSAVSSSTFVPLSLPGGQKPEEGDLDESIDLERSSTSLVRFPADVEGVSRGNALKGRDDDKGDLGGIEVSGRNSLELGRRSLMTNKRAAYEGWRSAKLALLARAP